MGAPALLPQTSTPTPGPVVSPVLARIWAGVLRVLGAAVSAPALTAAFVLWLRNSRDDPGYKSEWDLNKLTQAPTDQDRARLAYLERERLLEVQPTGQVVACEFERNENGQTNYIYSPNRTLTYQDVVSETEKRARKAVR